MIDPMHPKCTIPMPRPQSAQLAAARARLDYAGGCLSVAADALDRLRLEGVLPADTADTPLALIGAAAEDIEAARADVDARYWDAIRRRR